ncbi:MULTISPECIES: hypothetical protein [unclassified Spirosoma]|uniref:hypothetical protein n=1 Tax=unclassified Spirosoma TaxID=2621999 RepID=UPI00096908AA|nr:MULTISPECIES: hypothetical protein [unclassified Spirosoma]MBN8823823.1 hypothetical protein [Spirosoma sp.]OJW79780.1 MAG: hypothetical protein BGO59_00585 [Spirosoma sp. 48-14]
MTPINLSFRQTLGSTRPIGLIYGITLVLGLVVALPFYSTLLTEDQDSRAFLNLLNGFDYTIYSDFMQRSRKAILPLISVGRWLGALYLFLSIFFAGGILFRFSQPTARFDTGLFWQACTHYFGRFLRLFGVTLLFLLIGAGIWLVAGSLVAIVADDVLTERGQFWVGAAFFACAALTGTLILCIGDYAKVLMFREDSHQAFKSFGQAGRLVLGSILRTYGLYWLFILIGAGMFGLYFLIDEAILMSNWITILLMFIIQQAMIFGRIGLKVWALGTAYNTYTILPKPEPVLRISRTLIQHSAAPPSHETFTESVE